MFYIKVIVIIDKPKQIIYTLFLCIICSQLSHVSVVIESTNTEVVSGKKLYGVKYRKFYIEYVLLEFIFYL